MSPKQTRAALSRVKATCRCKTCSGKHTYVECTSETQKCYLDNMNHRLGDRNKCELWLTISDILSTSIKMRQRNVNTMKMSIFKLADYMLYDKESQPEVPSTLQQ